MRRNVVLVAMLAALALPLAARAETPAGLTSCKMTFDLRGWSAFYKEAKGEGTVTCDNGQKANVRLKVQGGGLSFGKYDVLNGEGTFSALKSVDEVFGDYAAASAQAGAVKSAAASAFTKGEVSLALAGKGRGIEIGFDFGKLEITPAR